MKQILGIAVLAVALAAGGTAEAQNYTISVGGPTTHNVDSSFDLTVELDSSAGIDLAGWSYGLCHDATLFDITAVAAGATTLTVRNGALPDFNNLNVLPGEGFTVGVVICFTSCAVLAPSSGNELNVATYSAGSAEGLGDVGFCNSLGLPPVATVVVEGGSSVAPAQLGTAIEIVAPPPPSFQYQAPNVNANFDATSGNGGFTTQFSIGEDVTNTGFPNLSQGFSMALQHDETILSVASGPTPVLPFSPDFTGPAVFSDGWTIGVVYSFAGLNSLAFDSMIPVIEIEYAISGLAGSPAITTPLTWSNFLGSPPVSNVVVVGGQSLDADFGDGSATLFPITDTPFLRADCNSDLRIDLADGIWVLNNLFQGGPGGTCAEACDADDNASVDLVDAIYIFQFLLLSGTAPAAPFPDCGIDAGALCDASSCP